MRSKTMLLLAVLPVVAAMGLAGCSNEPEKGVTEFEDVDAGWPSLDEKEDLIETILQCYGGYLDYPPDELEYRYASVLYDDSDDSNDYVWIMQEADVEQGHPGILTRDQDIDATAAILASAHELTLEIAPGEWVPADDVCVGCFETTREYTIYLSVCRGEEMVTLGSHGMRVRFIAGPHHDDSSKWAIYVAEDLPAVN